LKSLNKLSSENILQEKHKFLEYIFSHPKCEVLSDDEKSKISDAYNLAEEAHREQLQKRGTPYISHIQ
jgi:(p)ppGpp synthase/HD superfamily hydrolase